MATEREQQLERLVREAHVMDLGEDEHGFYTLCRACAYNWHHYPKRPEDFEHWCDTNCRENYPDGTPDTWWPGPEAAVKQFEEHMSELLACPQRIVTDRWVTADDAQAAILYPRGSGYLTPETTARVARMSGWARTTMFHVTTTVEQVPFPEVPE